MLVTFVSRSLLLGILRLENLVCFNVLSKLVLSRFGLFSEFLFSLKDVYVDNHVATIGVDFSSVVTMVKGKIVTMQLVRKCFSSAK